MQADIAIIGAGMAGLMAGRKLAQAGQNIFILDKGRRIGGRMASRRDSGFLFNHGAQFVTARSPEFSAICSEAKSQEILNFWPEAGRDSAYSGCPSMRDLASFMGQDLPILQEVEIQQIKKKPAGGFQLISTKGQSFQCQHLLVTAPAPQTAKLLRLLSTSLTATAAEAIYAPCWTVMAGLAEPDTTVKPIITDTDIIGWASCEASRPGAQLSGAVTIQGSEAFSQDFLEAPAEQIIAELTAAFAQAQNQLSLKWVYQRAHRWRYAKVLHPAKKEAPFIEGDKDGMLAVAGDWHPDQRHANATGSRAEDAVLSGYRAATEMLSVLSKRR